jgi:hypothetical protein
MSSNAGSITWDPPAPGGIVWDDAGATPSATAGGFAMGLGDIVHGGAQLLTKALPQSVVGAGDRLNNWLADKTGLVARLPSGGVDQQVREREAAYQAQRRGAGETGIDWARLAGNVVNPLTLATGAVSAPAAGAGLGLRMLSGASSGAAASALQPVAGDDYWRDKGAQVATGFAFGGAVPAAAAGVGRLISPAASTNPAVQALRNEGVRPTVGQALGGKFNAAEEKLMSVPWAGDAIRNARERGAEDLQRAVGQRALEPLGLKMPNLSGREAVRHVETTLGKAYDDLLPKLTWQADAPFAQQALSLRQMVNTGAMKPDAVESFNRILQSEVLSKMQGQNAMTGQTFKGVEANLSTMARRLGASTDYDQRLLGDAVKELQSAMRDALQRSNPQAQQELSAINQGWATFKRMQRAASYVGADDGAFNAAQLQSAVRAMDSSKDKARFSRGDALLQDLSDHAKTVMGAKVPNSGTTDRAALLGLPAYFFDPHVAAGVLAGPALYSAPGQALLGGLVASRPALAQPVAGLLNQAAPMLGPAGGLLSLEMLKQ